MLSFPTNYSTKCDRNWALNAGGSHLVSSLATTLVTSADVEVSTFNQLEIVAS